MLYRIHFIAIALLIAFASVSIADDKPDLSEQMTKTKLAVEDLAAKVGNYPKALAEVEKARSLIKKAEQTYEKGKQWLGLRGLTPEAEQEIRHHLQMIDMLSGMATTRMSEGKNMDEVAVLDKQLLLVKARVKLLEERKLETEKLQLALQKCELSAKELTSVKAEQTKLTSQIEQLSTERKKLEEQVQALKSENTTLSSQLEQMKKAASAPAVTPAAQTPSVTK